MEYTQHITYTEYSTLLNKLCLMIKIGRKKDDTVLEYVYGPPRGGLPLAVHLSHHLKLKFVIEISRDTWPLLLIDDIVDSGKTFSSILEVLPFSERYIKTAALFYNETSIIKPDFYAAITNRWIIFPWEEFKS